jgi:hypothetical protein
MTRGLATGALVVLFQLIQPLFALGRAVEVSFVSHRGS